VSFKVLVIPEDPTNNGYILKPLVEAILADAGKPGASWSRIRASSAMKETWFDPLLETEGDSRRAGGGRDQLIDASLKKMPALYQLCPELAELRDRIRSLLGR
jgi:hypothetical protein